MYNLNEILNTDEQVKIGEKIFKVRELTIKERAKLDVILRDYAQTLNSIKSDVEALTKEIATKDSTDFRFIKTALDICNPDLEFSVDDFEALTMSQVIKLQTIIMEKNNFLVQKNLPLEATH